MGRLLNFFNNKYPYTDFHELNADWLISAYKELLSEVDQLEDWKSTYEKQYQQLLSFYDDIISGDFPDSVKAAFYKWMQENAINLVGELVHLVIFNITDDGYFVAYIPEGWDDIIFGTTGLDTFVPDLQPEYGHLVLSYDTPSI